MGQKATFAQPRPPSVLPPKADIVGSRVSARRCDLANALDKFKPLTPERHIWRVPPKPREVSSVCQAPELQRAVAFALVVGKRLIDFIETSLRQFNRLEDGSRDALPVHDYHHFTDLRGEQALTFCPAGRALSS